MTLEEEAKTEVEDAAKVEMEEFFSDDPNHKHFLILHVLAVHAGAAVGLDTVGARPTLRLLLWLIHGLDLLVLGHHLHGRGLFLLLLPGLGLLRLG